MVSLNTVRSIKVSYISEGAEKFKTDAQAATAAQDNLGQATERTATITETASRRQLSALSGYDRLRASVDQTFRAQQTLERQTTTLDRAFQQSGGQLQGYDRTLSLVQERYNAVANAAQNAAAAEIAHARSLQTASTAQFEINKLLGVDRTSGGSARASALIFEEAEKEREAAAALIAARAQFISEARAQQAMLTSQFDINQRLGVGSSSSGAARASAAVFEEQFRLEEQQQKRLADLRASSARNAAAGWDQLGQIGRRQMENAEAARRVGALGASPAEAANQNGRLRADQAQNLLYQGGDIVAQLGSGSGLGMIAMQQGPQIAQVFAGPGGASVKGALSQAGEAASGFFSRIGLVGGAIGGVTAVALGGVAAFVSYRSSQSELEASLTGVGRASGATASQINAIAISSAQTGRVSVSMARSMAGEFAATGRIGTEMYAGLIGSANDYARATGQDLTEATTALAAAFADPTKGAERLNAQLGFLNDTARENIQRLQAQGNVAGAQKLLFDGYSASIAKAGDKVGFFSRQWQAFKNTTSGEVDAIGRAIDRVVSGGDLETRLATAQQVLANSQSRQGYLPFGIGAGDTAKAEAEVRRLQAELEKQRQQSQQAQQNQISIRIGDIARSLDPAAEQMKKISDQATDIRTNLSRLPLDEQGMARSAMEGLVAQSRILRENMQAGGAEYASSLRNAQFQQRTAGFSPTAQSAASIENEIAERGRTAESSGTREQQLAALQTLELERVTRLQTLQSQTYRETSSGSGRYSIGVGQAPAQYRDTIYDAANASGVNADLIASQIRQESRFNPNAVSPAGAQGISQFMPGTARGMGLSDPFNPSQAIPKQAELMAQLLKQFNGNEVAALIGYNAGPRRAERFLASGSDVSTLPKETQEYIKAIMTPIPGAQEMVATEVARRQAVEASNKAVADSAALYGKSGLQYDAAQRATQMLNEEVSRGRPVTDALRASISQLANEGASAAQKLKVAQFAADVGFDREQLGRPAGDQQAYARARSTIGDTTSGAAQFIIEQSRMNDNLRETKSLATDAFSSMLTDLRQGTTLAKSLETITGRLADKLLSKAADSVMSNLFAGLGSSGMGGSGGGFGSMIANALGLGGGAGTDIAAASARGASNPALYGPGFASGGYTGAGGRNEVAGPVHKGEYVFDAAATARIGVASLEAMRTNRRGWADGGYVGNAPTWMAPPANSQQQAPANIVVYNNSGSQVEAKEVDDGRGGRRQEIVINEAVAKGISSPVGQQALGQRRVARR